MPHGTVIWTFGRSMSLNWQKYHLICLGDLVGGPWFGGVWDWAPPSMKQNTDETDDKDILGKYHRVPILVDTNRPKLSSKNTALDTLQSSLTSSLHSSTISKTPMLNAANQQPCI